MRQGFTLIELMIVIAIIAIIAAIAIPTLLESRITANESAAAASLKSGFSPAQTQFQAGGYSDQDGDGRGEFAQDHQYLAGATSDATGTGSTAIGVSPKALALLGPQYRQTDTTQIGAYAYRVDIDFTVNATNIYNAESFWQAIAIPGSPGNDGRRAFGINAGGSIYGTKQTVANSNLTFSYLTSSTTGIFEANAGTTSNAGPNSTVAAPYVK